MKQMWMTLAALMLISSIAYFTLTHPNHAEVERLRHELELLESKNDAMRAQNADLERKIIALRDDPRLAERRAREAGGLAKPHELIYKFEDPSQANKHVLVKLLISPRRIELAGNSLTADQLPAALNTLAQEVPNAKLDVSLDDALGTIALQRVQDILDQAPIPHTIRNKAP